MRTYEKINIYLSLSSFLNFHAAKISAVSYPATNFEVSKPTKTTSIALIFIMIKPNDALYNTEKGLGINCLFLS